MIVEETSRAVLKNNNLVSKSNTLIESSYKLTLTEEKVMLCVASVINPSDKDFKTYRFSVKEFCDVLGLTNKKHGQLREITKELMKKVFEIRIGESVIQASWLSYVAYNKGMGTVDIRFDPFLKPYLLELDGHFTSYRLGNVSKLKSVYSIRLYELLKQYEKFKKRTFNVDDLKEILQVHENYPLYGNFKQKVLNVAKEELAAKTDISFTFEEIKNGRKVEKIQFNIISTRNLKADVKVIEEEIVEDNTLIMKQELLKLGINIKDTLLSQFEKEHGASFINDFISNMRLKINSIDDPTAYFVGTMRKNKDQTFEIENSVVSQINSAVYNLLKGTTEALPEFLIKNYYITEAAKFISTDDASQYWEQEKEELKRMLEQAYLRNKKRVGKVRR